MQVNIPLYRAKKIDGNEYVEGYYREGALTDKHFISIPKSRRKSKEIDASTLAIHFPDMLDSEGNKIFASLSEDGKGGDILENSHMDDYPNENGKVCMIDSQIRIKTKRKANRPFFDNCGWESIHSKHYGALKVIGIQK